MSAGDPDWVANFATTGALALRLETLRRLYRPTGPFGLEVLGRDAVHGRRVLEIGPGTGLHAATFLGRTGAVPQSWTLLDRSEAMVRAARAALAGRPGAFPGVVGDAACLPLTAAARFDLVVAMHVLLFVRAPRRVVFSLAARLAPGGRLLVTVPASGDLLALRRVVRAALRARGLPWRAVATLPYGGASAERDLRATFRRVDVHPQSGPLDFPDAATVVR